MTTDLEDPTETTQKIMERMHAVDFLGCDWLLRDTFAFTIISSLTVLLKVQLLLTDLKCVLMSPINFESRFDSVCILTLLFTVCAETTECST